MKKTTLIIIFSLLIMSIWAQREDFFCTISITQNASGRLATMDKADEDAYRQAKQMLRNPNSTKKQLRRSGKALRGIYKKKNAEMKLIMKEVAEKTGITFSLEDAGGTWLGGEEYSFKVAIEAPSQDAYDKPCKPSAMLQRLQARMPSSRTLEWWMSLRLLMRDC